ncbi:MAG: hypothetical protein A2806_04520 [Candidatus Terrybacteria bacterium RIFCSPHIGHO2_01_FULL_48_17]|uniref:Uncharacterized protein n=1 Tax=Candidatus Terrybacteria bacterium RIFCSPHIGHO2_01_FULL_48_17 TaxID=1802362 RepID=A0A1G2PKV3_9BACT|nr:MAG: hypothetical protein A2806_04520 [Candidatus Terrybacteria bacterium RIFCSPHIGHO2_01_FULL_48_17]OHA52839.1 MAG: hypothetical protein A3A30_03000 [Candidatus Terrybacteria bacterium RIFCSPLOWO2_01_FULL_48_14]
MLIPKKVKHLKSPASGGLSRNPRFLALAFGSLVSDTGNFRFPTLSRFSMFYFLPGQHVCMKKYKVMVFALC